MRTPPGKTTLYQRPRSPLIEGHSKMERPAWHLWLVGAGIALLAIAVVWWFRLDAGSRGLGHWWDSFGPDLLSAIIGALLGSVFGVTLARSWGMRHPWAGGAVAALVLGYLAAML